VVEARPDGQANRRTTAGERQDNAADTKVKGRAGNLQIAVKEDLQLGWALLCK
jgi:hypothetical protein